MQSSNQSDLIHRLIYYYFIVCFCFVSVFQLINLFANDGQRIFDFVVLGVLIVGGPVVGVGGVVYILWLLGPYALSGMLAFLLFYPIQVTYIPCRLRSVYMKE